MTENLPRYASRELVIDVTKLPMSVKDKVYRWAGDYGCSNGSLVAYSIGEENIPELDNLLQLDIPDITDVCIHIWW